MYDTTKRYLNDVEILVRSTWQNSSLVSVRDGGILVKNFNGPEIDHTDGIGSKGVLHWKHRTFGYAVRDAVAMNLNDLAMLRAEPYKMQSHIMLPKEDKLAILEIFKEMSHRCQIYNIALTGGETAIHDNLEGLEISITMSGRVLSDKPNLPKIGDVLVALPSNGLHSNGFTKVRSLGYPLDSVFIKQALFPTKVYLLGVLHLSPIINGMMHITGGGFAKLRRILPDGADMVLHHRNSQPLDEVFQTLYRDGVSEEEMYRTFNCGAGFILSVSPENVNQVMLTYKDAFRIGEMREGKGRIIIDSIFSENQLEV